MRLPRIDQKHQTEVRDVGKEFLKIMGIAVISFLIALYPGTVGVAVGIVAIIVLLYVMFGPTKTAASRSPLLC